MGCRYNVFQIDGVITQTIPRCRMQLQYAEKKKEQKSVRFLRTGEKFAYEKKRKTEKKRDKNNILRKKEVLADQFQVQVVHLTCRITKYYNVRASDRIYDRCNYRT